MTTVGGRPARPQIGKAMKKRDTPEEERRRAGQREWLYPMFAAGLSDADIAKAEGMARQAVTAFRRGWAAQSGPIEAAPGSRAELKLRVTELWSEGHSTAEIGRRTGNTKNKIVGIAHRLGLPPRPSPIVRGLRAGTPKPPRIPRAKGPTLVPLAFEPQAEPPAAIAVPEPRPGALRGAAGLDAAKERTAPRQVEIPKPAPTLPRAVTPSLFRTCQFIRDEKTGPGWMPDFCGASVTPGKSYCAEHCDLCYSKVPAWGQKLGKLPEGV